MKTFRYALVSLLLALLAACSQEGGAPAAAQPAAAAPASAPAAADAPAFTPVAGQHYVEIADPQPFQPLDGRIEVVEVFGYTCPACASFEPLVSAWKARQPDDVRVTLLAAPFGGYWMPYAKAFYAAEAQGLVDATHQAMFDAVHRQRSLPVQGVSTEAIAEAYAAHGADAKEFARTMESFAVSGQMRRARQFVDRTGVDSTPTMIVNGRYRVIAGQDFQDVLRTVDYLVERERAAAGAGAVEAEQLADETAEDVADDTAG